MVFIQVPADRIQQEFPIDFSGCAVMKTSEILIFLDISKMSFCLDRADLPVQDPFLTLDIGMGFLLAAKGGQSLHAYPAAHNGGVGHSIQLLKNIAENQRKGEGKSSFSGFPSVIF